MGFSDQQLRQLSRRVPVKRIRTRISDGKELSYIEGWFALEQANRIFGFDGWDRETVEVRCLHTHHDRNGATAVYSARVRISVRGQGATIVRDGHGTGEAHAATLAEAHDRALKGAETDATKRALATFGKAFGLALYGGTNKPSAAPDKPLSPGAGTASPTAVVPAQPTPTPGLGRRVASSFKLPAVPGRAVVPIMERHRNKAHLRYVASQPCLLCGYLPSDAHHISYAQSRALGRKVSDEYTVPLCRNHHRELHHEGSEAAWWHDMGIDPLPIAKELWAHSQARGKGSPERPNTAIGPDAAD